MSGTGALSPRGVSAGSSLQVGGVGGAGDRQDRDTFSADVSTLSNISSLDEYLLDLLTEEPLFTTLKHQHAAARSGS